VEVWGVKVVEITVFALLALLTVGSALLMIIQRNPVYSALFLILTFFAQAGLFVLLNAQFIAAVQVLINAGAVMVLFLFVVMLLDLRREPVVWIPGDWVQLFFGITLALAFFAEIAFVVWSSSLKGVQWPFLPEKAEAVGNTQLVGGLLFTDFLFPFEVTSIILLVAIVGAMVLAKRKLD